MWVLWLLKHTSFKEVSRMFGISYGRVKKILMEALAMIKLPELVADDLKVDFERLSEEGVKS